MVPALVRAGATRQQLGAPATGLVEPRLAIVQLRILVVEITSPELRELDARPRGGPARSSTARSGRAASGADCPRRPRAIGCGRRFVRRLRLERRTVHELRRGALGKSTPASIASCSEPQKRPLISISCGTPSPQSRLNSTIATPCQPERSSSAVADAAACGQSGALSESTLNAAPGRTLAHATMAEKRDRRGRDRSRQTRPLRAPPTRSCSSSGNSKAGRSASARTSAGRSTAYPTDVDLHTPSTRMRERWGLTTTGNGKSRGRRFSGVATTTERGAATPSRPRRLDDRALVRRPLDRGRRRERQRANSFERGAMAQHARMS